MIIKKRHNQILEMIKTHKTLSIAEIAEKLQISEITARRDLEFLDNNTKLLVRIRGGAQWVEDQPEPNTAYLNDRYSERYAKNQQEKTAIGKLAAALIKEDETIIIDAGSSAIQLAKHVDGKKRITAVVTAINVAEELEGKEGVVTVITGGVFRSRTTTLISPFIEQSLMSIYADKVFIGVAGVSMSHGFTDNDLLETDVKKILCSSGREIYWLVDSSKVGLIASFHISKILPNHTIITDYGISPQMKDELGKMCRVLVAERG
jgi:DeoR/GlpR family transcriptional regulator of sugar metabolism